MHAADDASAKVSHRADHAYVGELPTRATTDCRFNSIVVSIVDNDAPEIVINEIDSDQTGTDTLEFVELYDGGVGNVSLNGNTLVLFNGATDTRRTRYIV